MKIKKMWSDGLPTNNPQETGRLNQNVILTKQLGSLVNEDGFSHVLDLPIGLIGKVEMNDSKVTLFFHNPLLPTPDEIGIVNLLNNTYTSIVKANFNFSSRIKGLYNKEFNDDDIIVFWDDDNQPRIINLTTLPFELDSSLIPIDSNKIDLINLFPSKKYVNYSLLDVSSGGSLLTGVYYFSLEYELPDGTLTDAINISNPVSIIKDLTNYSSNQYAEGDIEGTQTNKSITLEILNIDTKYKFFRPIVIHKIGGVLQAYRLGKYYTSNNKIEYKGTETKSEISLSSLLVKTANVKTIADATVLNDELILGGITEKDKVNLQDVANNISVKWGIDESNLFLPIHSESSGLISAAPDSSDTYKDSKIIFKYGGFQTNDVYALYIKGIYNDGSKTEAFHIPGRDALSTERNTNLLTNSEIALNAKNFHFNDYSASDGRMGFWENENEIYPEGYGNLTGKKVRHHRFPSLSKLKEWGFDDFYCSIVAGTHNKHLVKPSLHLIIDNVVIPDNLKSQLQGFEICYAKRELNNRLILDECLLLPSNWEDDYVNHDYSTLRLHPFNMLKYKPSQLPTHFIDQLELTKRESGTEISNGVASYLNQATHKIYVRDLGNVKYIPNNNTADIDYNNEFREEFLYATTGQITKPANSSRRVFGYVYKFALNLYSNFYEQQLVSTGYVHLFNGTLTDRIITKLYGGDTTKSVYYYRVIPPLEDAVYKGVEFGCIVESSSNIELRYTGQNWWETYYPKQLIDSPLDHDSQPYTDTHEIPNYLGYNSDYSSVNDLSDSFPYNPFDKTINMFPNRIMKSLKNNRETSEFNWRTFLTNDYYETRREFGKIIGLITYSSKLLIHLDNALLVTITTDRLKTSALEASLGTGQIFEREPDIIVDSKTGYAGLYSKFDNDVNLLGYCWLDRKSKSIFTFDGKLDKISVKGLNNFFNDNITIEGDYRVFYEERYNRLFVTVNNKSYSYVNDVDGWVAQHTFFPDFILSIRNELYSTKQILNTNRVYKHSVKGNKGLYYHNLEGARDINKSFITAVYNQGNEKILQSVSWIGDVYNESNILQNKTFDNVVISDTDKCSGNIEIVVLDSTNLFSNNTRKIRKYWTFNSFRDLVDDKNEPFIDAEFEVIDSNINPNKEFHLKKRFMDAYFIAKLEFNNEDSSDEIVFDDIKFEVTELSR